MASKPGLHRDDVTDQWSILRAPLPFEVAPGLRQQHRNLVREYLSQVFTTNPRGDIYMRKTHLLLTGLMLTAFFTTVQAWEPDLSNKSELEVHTAILGLLEKDPGMKDWFDNSAGYAVFPKVGKGGLGVGGAYGRGLVISGNQVIGTTSLSQLSIGLQMGGQVYSEFIFFYDQTALDDFQRGNFEVGAQVSAVAATAGASADASYNKGVAIFTNVGGGLMYEASIGGQKFKYEAK
jgi:lipid-binding SYLF domain-containing protein